MKACWVSGLDNLKHLRAVAVKASQSNGAMKCCKHLCVCVCVCTRKCVYHFPAVSRIKSDGGEESQSIQESSLSYRASFSGEFLILQIILWIFLFVSSHVCLFIFLFSIFFFFFFGGGGGRMYNDKTIYVRGRYSSHLGIFLVFFPNLLTQIIQLFVEMFGSTPCSYLAASLISALALLPIFSRLTQWIEGFT